MNGLSLEPVCNGLSLEPVCTNPKSFYASYPKKKKSFYGPPSQGKLLLFNRRVASKLKNSAP